MRPLKLYIISFLLLLVTLLQAQNASAPKYEYRAVWLTTIENLDWPKSLVKSKEDVERQQKELCVILDSLHELNINTVLLQTRVRGDVIYPSSIEPFSHVLTGVEGKSPGYDPLAFAIEECHKRGMQLHAWLVTLPLGKDEHIKRQGKLALSRKRKELCTHYKGAWYMEPGNPGTAEYIVELVEEIVSKYDVDGIHLDYVRYPDRTNGYPDSALYRKYSKRMSLADWRRSNITAIVELVYKSVKAKKPWVRVSSAPLGKYDDLTRYSSLGWDAYNAVYQEAQKWMKDGVMDALFPMLYFNGNNFYPFVLDWCENSYGRHIVPGVGIYRLSPQYGGWDEIEIERQFRTSRGAGSAGVALFRAAHVLGNAGGARNVVVDVYNEKALVPPMPWWGTEPARPQISVAARDEDGISLEWGKVSADDNFPAVRYNVYGALGDTVDISNVQNMLVHSLADTLFRWDCRSLATLTVAVTAVNACGVESGPVMVTFTGKTQLADVVELPASRSWGQRIEVVDMSGRRIYYGKYSRKVDMRGVPHGCYILNVYNRHGSRISTQRVFH